MLRAHTAKRLLQNVISPDQYDFWAREMGSITAWERCFARVISCKEEAQDTVSLTLRPNGNFPGYDAGQHMNLSATIGGRRITRSYSFTSSPDQSGLVSVTVRRDPQGAMSDWLCREARPGAVLEINGVFGDMTLAQIQPEPEDYMVLLAAGSGITPFISLIRARLTQSPAAKVTLLYWERSPEYFCFNAELDALTRQYPNLVLHRLTTQSPMDGKSVSGRVDAEQLNDLLGSEVVDKHAQPLAFICGGAGFVQSARALMADRARQIFAEAFSPLKAAPTVEKVETHSVTLLHSQRVLQVSNQETLLDALERQGVAVESGCRMGICNTCSCATAAGRARDITTGQFHSGQATRLCVSQAVSNLQLDL